VESITVRKLGYTGNEIFRWTGQLVARDEDAVVVEARFNVTRVDLGYVVFERGDLFVEFYYWRRWFNVFQIFAADGTLKGWYCNLATPPRFEDGMLEYRDLALDLFVRPDGTWVEDDREEYDDNRIHLYHPDDVVAAEAGLAELRVWIDRGTLPIRPAR
jgi:protein associated with RNAse G/E